MAPLRYAAKFDPFLSLDSAPTPSTLAQSKERKGSNFAIWQPCFLHIRQGSHSPASRSPKALTALLRMHIVLSVERRGGKQSRVWRGGIFLRWSPQKTAPTHTHTPTPFSVLTNGVEHIHTSAAEVVVARFIFWIRGSATMPINHI